ncbi:hypothetical protein HZ326_26880 [Fusarium oxysporum f. sp. albedinis]|nr:hypothetical protein HZ326_26880 [Fusarium oxysporum f. sp. albedinis]
MSRLLFFQLALLRPGFTSQTSRRSETLIPFQKTPSQIFAKDEVQALPPLAEDLMVLCTNGNDTILVTFATALISQLSSQYLLRDQLPLLLEAIPACEYMVRNQSSTRSARILLQRDNKLKSSASY